MGRGEAQPLGRAHNYESEACSYSGLFILPSIRSMSAMLQLTAVRPSVFFHGTTTAQVVVQIVVLPIVNGLV